MIIHVCVTTYCVRLNNSLGLFCRPILRGAKLEECPARDKHWGVEGYQNLNCPPEASLHGLQEGWKWETSFPMLPLDRKPAVCYSSWAQPTVSFWHLTLGVLGLGNVQLSRGISQHEGAKCTSSVSLETAWKWTQFPNSWKLSSFPRKCRKVNSEVVLTQAGLKQLNISGLESLLPTQ